MGCWTDGPTRDADCPNFSNLNFLLIAITPRETRTARRRDGARIRGRVTVHGGTGWRAQAEGAAARDRTGSGAASLAAKPGRARPPHPCPKPSAGRAARPIGAGGPPSARRGNGAESLRGGLAPAGAPAGGAPGAQSRQERPGAQDAPLAPATEGARPDRCCRPPLSVAAPDGKGPGPLPVADREDGGGGGVE